VFFNGNLFANKQQLVDFIEQIKRDFLLEAGIKMKTLISVLRDQGFLVSVINDSVLMLIKLSQAVSVLIF
jgi:hypothetical protein